MKKISAFYTDIKNQMVKESNPLIHEFEYKTKSEDPKQIFLWLKESIGEESCSKEMEAILTDFFFSIH